MNIDPLSSRKSSMIIADASQEGGMPDVNYTNRL